MELENTIDRLWNPIVVCPQCRGFLNLNSSNICFNCNFIYNLNEIKEKEIRSSTQLFESSSDQAAKLDREFEDNMDEPEGALEANRHYNSGLQYGRLGKLEAAKKEFTLALKYNQFHVNSIIALGIVHVKLNNLKDAEMAWKLALALDPENRLIREYLLKLKRNLKDD